MILYVETNFLMAVASGREVNADVLFAIPSETLHIALPEVCIMEAFSAFEDELKRRNRFGQELDTQKSNISRDSSSKSAKSLLRLLELARIDNDELLNDIRARLQIIVERLTTQTPEFRGAELLALSDLTPFSTEAIIGKGSSFIPDQPTDSLILTIILNHARNHPDETKILLTENKKDFESALVSETLQDAGIRYFSQSGSFLGWFNAQSTSSVKPNGEIKN